MLSLLLCYDYVLVLYIIYRGIYKLMVGVMLCIDFSDYVVGCFS